jgi:hypothetical protein
MEELLIRNAPAYASQHQLRLAERLGFGIRSIIFVAEDNSKAGKTAIKIHHRVPRARLMKTPLGALQAPLKRVFVQSSPLFKKTLRAHGSAAPLRKRGPVEYF